MDVKAAERDLLNRLMGARRPDEVRPRDEPGSAVASYGQQQLWLIDQINPGTRENLVSESVRLTGTLDAQALRAAFIRLVERHEILRTRFDLDDDGALVQLVDENPRVPFTFSDLRECGAVSRETVNEQLSRMVVDPFDLEHGPLLRVELTRADSDEHILTFVMHHIVCDGWSFGVIKRELPALYAAARDDRVSPLDPLAIQYGDFSNWQRSHAREALFERQLTFWREHLAGLAPFDLPTDLPRPPIRTGNGDELYLPLTALDVKRVSELAHAIRVTPYMIYLAVYQVLLSKLSGVDDIALGTPVSGRNRIETEGLIGFLVNTVVVRADLSGDPSFVEYLGRVREVCLDSFSHQDVPFTKLVDELCARRDLSRTPLFQNSFVYNAPTTAGWTFPDLRCEVLHAPLDFAKSDMSVSITETASGGTVRVEYSTDIFYESTARRVGGRYLRLLRSLLGGPDAAISESTISETG